MNNPNPFIPQGSLLDQKNRKRANFKVAVFSIFGFTALLMSFFLIQGCKDKTASDTGNGDMAANSQTNTPDTNTQPPQLPPPGTPGTTGSNVAQTPQPIPQPIPQPVPQPQPTPPPQETTSKDYTIVKGDSFYSIAKKFGVKMKEVEAANPSIPPTKLKVGMKIQIPAGGSSGGGATPTMDSGASDTYTVKSGDSLTKIAKSLGTTVKAIRTENNLKTDKIKVGQKLKVPAKTGTTADVSTPSAPPAASMPPPSPVSSPAPSNAPGH